MMYRIGPGSRESKLYVVGIKNTPNKLGPVVTKPRIVPINNLKLGYSLFFDKQQILKEDVEKIKTCVRTAHNTHCLVGEPMFKIIEKKTSLEVVRIR